MEQPVQSQRISLSRTEIQATFRSHMRFHAEVPLISFPRLVHFRVPRTRAVLRSTGCRNQRGINRRPHPEHQAFLAQDFID